MVRIKLIKLISFSFQNKNRIEYDLIKVIAINPAKTAANRDKFWIPVCLQQKNQDWHHLSDFFCYSG